MCFMSTTIIETGLDISNVNTMIIHDADRLGLSQLYQLRGASSVPGVWLYTFCYAGRDKLLKEIAEKRLAAIGNLLNAWIGIQNCHA